VKRLQGGKVLTAPPELPPHIAALLLVRMRPQCSETLLLQSLVRLQYDRRRLARNVDGFGANLLATANALFSHVSNAIF